MSGQTDPMQPRMTDSELRLFNNVLACADNYLEFGCGGSTAAAAARVKNSIISVDSSQHWVDEVTEFCARQPAWVQPQMYYVDVGPIGNWGTPTDPATRDRWPDYHARIWEHPQAANADLYMVDGRFRVACCLQIALHARSDVLVAVHDYAARPEYHVVTEFLRPVVRAEGLWVFQRRRDHNQNRLRAMLSEYALVTD